MRIAVIDAFNGASGNMIIGALYDEVIQREDIEKIVDELNLEVEYKIERVVKKGITSNLVRVKSETKERSFKEVVELVESSRIDERVKKEVIKIFERLAKAEGKVHGRDYKKAKFHEVGSDDAIFDITLSALGFLRLRERGYRIYTNRVKTGVGFVEFTHGRYPSPAPATLEILANSKIEVLMEGEGELLTPTAAAILAHFSEGTFKNSFKINKILYGAGEKETEVPNVLRIILGEAKIHDRIVVVETNIDDLSPEYLSYAVEKLSEMSHDVYVTPVLMKKGRLGSLLSAIVSYDKAEEVAEKMMELTGSLGVRILPVEHRLKAYREVKEIKVKINEREYRVRVKVSDYRIKPEYEDVKRICEAENLSPEEVYKRIMKVIE